MFTKNSKVVKPVVVETEVLDIEKEDKLRQYSPIDKLFGINFCWILETTCMYRKTKGALGSFFMALYRVICLRRPAMKDVYRRKIVDQLIWLERIVTLFLIGLLQIGLKLR